MRQGVVRYFLRNIIVKHRVSVRDNDDSEMYYTHMSLMGLIGAVAALVVVAFAGAVLLCANTPLLDIFPNYVGHESRRLMTDNLTKLDSLSSEITDIMDYVDNITMVLEGKSPVMRSSSETEAVVKDSMALASVAPSQVDSLFRAGLEGNGRYGLNRGSTDSGKNKETELLPPLRGEVTEGFDAGTKHYDTHIKVTGIKQVVAMQSGTVLLSVWSPEEGNILQIMHSSDFIATYKNMSQVFKTTGDKVRAGEVIGTVWPAGDNDTTDEFRFELWYGGQPVDAQNYMTFRP